MDKIQVSDFDISEYLNDKEVIAEYLSQILADRNIDELLEALGYIAKAKGITQLAKETGLGRESLYKIFKKGANPRFETILKIVNSLGVKLKVVA